MRPSCPAAALTLFALFSLCGSLSCRRAAAPASRQTETPAATGSATVPSNGAAGATAPPASTATQAATPFAGASFQVGAWTVVVDRFRAQISDPDGVNIRSSPEVKPDNRSGSLLQGATVEVEGRVLQGQEAVAGQGTTWYYLGTAGTTPQFVYGQTGALTPLSGSATAVPAATGTATVTATLSPTPSP